MWDVSPASLDNEVLMGKLEMQFKIGKLSVSYIVESAKWTQTQAEFTVVNQHEGLLIIYRDNINAEQSILEKAWDELERQCNSFKIAMRYFGNHDIECKMTKALFYHDGKEYTLQQKQSIPSVVNSINHGGLHVDVVIPALSGSCSMTNPSIPLPEEMPIIPSECEGWAMILIQAAEWKTTEKTTQMCVSNWNL